jgi:hypothetical protein
LLLHLGSFRDASVPSRQVLHDIPCLDISEFGRQNLDEILQTLAPDVIVGLNLATLFDRTVILTARRLGVPTVFLQHGSWTDPDEVAPLFASLDRGFTWADRVRRLPKFARLLPLYLHARGSTLLDPAVWRMLARLARTPTLSHFYPMASDELHPVLALLFKEKDAEIKLTVDSKTKVVGTGAGPRTQDEAKGRPDLDFRLFGSVGRSAGRMLSRRWLCRTAALLDGPRNGGWPRRVARLQEPRASSYPFTSIRAATKRRGSAGKGVPASSSLGTAAL